MASSITCERAVYKSFFTPDSALNTSRRTIPGRCDNVIPNG
jgi:hypothetical protein